ncbi:SAVED domain-containing protein [Rhizobium leguminosarum bv. viciae]|uniref:SAVED domain-containing protein n=1 Tax=Rhizobium leguminosarum bv. viciae TaxID=387 RepID=A0A8I2GNI9_RHILV|nr:HNH endonuclease [Rhizobium leguminosarum]MBY5529695.1 HNH endonuclease [Rhizobium leguminosarum]NKM46055.1 SAVED domain-containing protein [Rhizobium leguminosarum bv. viciae]UFW79902.1 HNH endonuclease [Rhizobium leguminosarum bv. viciae]
MSDDTSLELDDPDGSSADKRSGARRRESIPPNVKAIIWGRSAGRCAFCNKPLIGDLTSGKSNLNTAYIAHIISDAPGGPRGDPVLSPALAKDPSNLMLLCDTHHRLIDGRSTWHEYPVELLRKMKADHESRIETVTSILLDASCHVIRYAAGIGSNESPVNVDAIKSALLPTFYPSHDGMIDLDIPDLGIPDHDPSYWPLHQKTLRDKFLQRVRGRLERGEINRLVVFGLAPMPLLIELGRLISDISEAHVRQLLREPKGWAWDVAEPALSLEFQQPKSSGKQVVLKLGVSASVDDDRVTAVLGADVSIWSLSAEGAHNDIMRTPDDLALWRREVRRVLETIANRHTDAELIHVFPAIPLSAAIELGRVWMPKANLPMRIYDHNRALGGSRPTIDIVHGG